MVEEIEKIEPLYAVDSNIEWCGLCGNSWIVLKNSKQRITIWPSNSTPRCISKENKSSNICIPAFLSAIFIITKKVDTSCVHQ